MNRGVTRRRFLTASGAVVLVVASCSSDEEHEDTDDDPVTSDLDDGPTGLLPSPTGSIEAKIPSSVRSIPSV